ncbi:MFS transporter [Kibdelosporangium aridum]|uniref:MFS transporter n=1 Tax=Kibdelosporangium aridum TaxID=2030 RepID=UPI00056ABC03|nr:MFS transporter [Kibdelosporangium aridum]
MSDSGLRSKVVLGVIAAETISQTSTRMTWVALPWLVLTTTGSPAKMGAVLTANLLAMSVFGIPGGALAGRLGPWRTMLLCDLVRAVLICLIPLLHMLGALNFVVLLVLVFLVGAFYIPHHSSQQVVLPAAVGDSAAAIAKANSVLQGTLRLASLLGPPTGGFLVGLFGAPAVLWFDGATYLCSALIVWRVVPRVAPRPETQGWSALTAGTRTLWRDWLLRRWTIAISVFEFSWQLVIAALPILVVFRYGGAAIWIGVLTASLGIGSVLGNIVVLRVMDRVEPLWWSVLTKIPQTLVFWLLVVNLPILGVCAVLAVAGLLNGLIEGPVRGVQMRRTPKAMWAPAMGAFFAVSVLCGSVGLAVTGPIVEASNITAVFVVAAVFQTLGTIPFVTAALRARAESPAQPVGTQDGWLCP